MKIDMFLERYETFRNDVKREIIEAVQKNGGCISFISEDDSRLKEIDDLSDLGLESISAYSHNFCNYADYYITRISIGLRGNLVYYGIRGDSDIDLEYEEQLDFISLYDLILILEQILEYK